MNYGPPKDPLKGLSQRIPPYPMDPKKDPTKDPTKDPPLCII